MMCNNTSWQVSAWAHHPIFMPSMMSGWAFVPRCFFVLTLSVCLSFTLLFSSHFYLYSVLNLFFHVDNAKANITCVSANRGVLLSGRIHSYHRVMSPSSLTTSTTRRLLKSSRRNPETKIRGPCTCVTRNSTMRPSGKRHLHHCSFRREDNQRTEDKLITLIKEVCCQLCHFSRTQERRGPCTNVVR